LQPEDVAALKALWTAMKPFAGLRPRPPRLGYRGCHITQPGGRSFIYRGAVTLTAGRSTESRADVDGVFERRVLASAPTGMIPRALIRR
jgi:hypothetical protein